MGPNEQRHIISKNSHKYYRLNNRSMNAFASFCMSQSKALRSSTYPAVDWKSTQVDWPKSVPKLTESSQIEGARFLILSWYPLYPSQYHEPKLIYSLPMDLKHKGIPGFLLALGHCSVFGISPLIKPPKKKQFMDSKFYLKFQW